MTKDFRIGNIVNIYQGNRIGLVLNCIVEKLDTASVNDFDIDDVKSIELTAGILTRLGCKVSDNDHFIWRTPEGKLFTFRKSDNTAVCVIFGRIVEIKTVHDFQNAVHIAGEEITFV